MNRWKTAFVITLTILYSGIWFFMHFLIIGFFMPSPVRFCKKISGRKRRQKVNTSSRYGLNDDSELDEMMYYDSVDD